MSTVQVVMVELPGEVPELFMRVLAAVHMHDPHDLFISQLWLLALFIYESAVGLPPSCTEHTFPFCSGHVRQLLWLCLC